VLPPVSVKHGVLLAQAGPAPDRNIYDGALRSRGGGRIVKQLEGSGIGSSGRFSRYCGRLAWFWSSLCHLEKFFKSRIRLEEERVVFDEALDQVKFFGVVAVRRMLSFVLRGYV
jgi:hypothetical protein